MKLFYSETSPFARKVRMLLELTGLNHDTEMVKVLFTDPTLREQNPLGKIPALVDGELSLYDSPLICEYLNNIHVENGGKTLIDRTSKHYYQEQLVAATANGLVDAAINAVFERKRETEPSDYWIDRWHTAIQAAITTIDLRYAGSSQKVSIATLSLASALGYLDFRKPDLAWREWNPALKPWFEEISNETWFANTTPPKTL